MSQQSETNEKDEASLSDELVSLRQRIADLDMKEAERKRTDTVQAAIYRISEATLAAHDLDDLYRSIHAIVARLMPARNFYITLYDEESGLFTIPYLSDEFTESYPPYKPGKGLGAYVLRTGKPLLATPEVFAELERSGEAVIIERRMVDWLGVPLKNQFGKTIGVMAVQTYSAENRLNAADQDVLVFVSSQVAMAIERKQAAQALQDYASELEQHVTQRTMQLENTNKELEAFSYSVSHDLRGPLRAIDGYSSILLEDYGALLGTDGRDLLHRIRKASQHMGQLIDDLLKLSRLTQQTMIREEVNLTALAKMISKELCEAEPERKVEIEIGEQLTVHADPRLVRVMLVNLFSNAMKFTRRTREAKIEFNRLEDGDEPVFFIRDNGAGFDMQFADKLFGAFERLHTGEEFEGSGVGLATVRRIVNLHGGRVWAEAALNQGAAFYFTLG